MKFSIIIPTYNAGQYFNECIESVLKQHITDWELIIVDDGSTDGSGELADKYATEDERIKVIHKKNEGQFCARKDRILAAKGDYIICLDSDDYWEEECLSVLNEAICQYFPDVIMFPCRIIGKYNDEEPTVGVWSDKLEFPDKQSVYKEIISSHTLNSMVLKIFKRNLFFGSTTNYDKFEGRGYGEDKVQTLHIFTQAETIMYIPKVLYNYRYNISSVSNTVDFSQIPAMVANDMYALVYEYMKLWGLQDAEDIQSFATYYLRNYIYVVYNFRKRCTNGALKKQFKKYNWRNLLAEQSREHIYKNKLSMKEKIKLFFVLHMSWAL